MAQSGRSLRRTNSVAIGPKRTCGEALPPVEVTRQLGHERVAFAAMHGPDLLYLIRDPWPWGKAHETARVCSPARRRRGYVAACGTHAAAAAGDRISPQCI